MTTWRALLAEATGRVGSLDARVLVEEAAGVDPGEWFAILDDEAPRLPALRMRQLIERRASGEPLQYTIGHWGFRALDLMVDPRVLIPRPETETVVDAAIDQVRGTRDRPLIVDLGTGSGAIALSLAQEVPGSEVWATDVSEDALDVASANAAGIGMWAATRVRFALGSWFDALPPTLRGRVDLLVSNPPYVADDESLPPEVAEWEPALALRSGPTGLESVAAVLEGAQEWVAPDGAVVLEIAPHQRTHVIAAAGAAGWSRPSVRRDLAGRERVLVARR